MGRVLAMTNVEEVVEELRKAQSRVNRWQEVIQDEDSNRGLVEESVTAGLAKNLIGQGRVSPGGRNYRNSGNNGNRDCGKRECLL